MNVAPTCWYELLYLRFFTMFGHFKSNSLGFFYKYVFFCFFSFFKQNHRVGSNPYIHFFPNMFALPVWIWLVRLDPIISKCQNFYRNGKYIWKYDKEKKFIKFRKRTEQQILMTNQLCFSIRIVLECNLTTIYQNKILANYCKDDFKFMRMSNYLLKNVLLLWLNQNIC